MLCNVKKQPRFCSTGALSDGAVGARMFDRPGMYTYICKEHPWAYGQIVVVE